MSGASGEEFSVVVLASDLGVDARSLLTPSERRHASAGDDEVWHDCPSHLGDEDFSDLDALQAFRVEGADRSGCRILRIVGKFFPAQIISGERLRRYVFHKIQSELPEGPFCVVYMHSTVQSGDNNPGMSVLRWIYQDLPPDFKERLRVVYFLHPGLRSRLAIATFGRFFLSGGLYWKIKYVSRLQYLWEDIKKGEVEIPEFVQRHDEVLEHRPLTDYGIEPDPLHLTEVPSLGYSLGRYEDKWSSRDYY
ncbi:ganglioside-induced differentiation-associated protein 2 [Ananas comosus]|uniref:Ganglioside-induced differentiation-associated protein 2 n=1 Tax=Ananas comosus TaxID=4615 RepID=A0A199VZB4_ANACO|nr:ganglioside-induced differentiation-associated protein 2 [Ananas comosus]OAY82020.1 Ganglioside-induced differentiation-associated protein 2 [Ananas comosus]